MDIAHKLGITTGIVKNVLFHAKHDEETPGNYKSSRKITEEQLLEIKLEVAKMCAENKAITDHDVDEMFNKKAMENGKLAPGKSLDPQTLKKLRDCCGMTKRKAKAKVDSRSIAEGDIRNYISTAAAFKSVLHDVPPHLILNWDETSTLFDEEAKDLLVTVVKDELTTGEMIFTKVAKCPSFFVKYLATVNADGDLGPTVLHFAQKSLDIVDQRHEMLEGFGANNQPLCMYFSKTRSGSAQYFKWYVKEVLIPWVKYQRSIHRDPETKRAVVLCDGEMAQTRTILDDQECVKLLKENYIDIVKLPAGCSGRLQPCDVMVLFRSLKQQMRKKKASEEVQNDDTKKKVTSILRDLGKDGKKWTLGNARGFALASLFIVGCLKKAYRYDQVCAGFQKIGAFPLKSELTLRCMKNVDNNVVQSAIESMGTYATEFAEKGYVSENTMTANKVPIHPGLTHAKDHNVAYQQRALWLTSENTRKRLADMTRAMKEQADEEFRKNKDDQLDVGGRHRAENSHLKRSLYVTNGDLLDSRAENTALRADNVQLKKRAKTAENENKAFRQTDKRLRKENATLKALLEAERARNKSNKIKKKTTKKASDPPMKLKCCACGCTKEVDGNSSHAHSWQRCGKCSGHRCNRHTSTSGDFPCK